MYTMNKLINYGRNIREADLQINVKTVPLKFVIKSKLERP